MGDEDYCSSAKSVSTSSHSSIRSGILTSVQTAKAAVKATVKKTVKLIVRPRKKAKASSTSSIPAGACAEPTNPTSTSPIVMDDDSDNSDNGSDPPAAENLHRMALDYLSVPPVERVFFNVDTCFTSLGTDCPRHQLGLYSALVHGCGAIW
ncbi:hypothetical protein PAXRUDRAFT_17578 [Paxillus rubicundulus Ve08.2h10]|uniref:Uncharacterized protein n=1 Tax=Paxillus rubicundulus Ve08.2h10 TaxID=930991 RepID=A0A0D0D1A6_9AGAM|nr:hypothetical protein PAXRUDRAFT_17578 [Paxillus rubicundulus Ve08.2h10]